MLAYSSNNNSAKKTWLLHFYYNKTMGQFLLRCRNGSAELNQKIHKPAPKFLSESKDLQTHPKVLI